MTITQREMKELAGLCLQINCDREATHIVYWPGQTTKACEEHAQLAIRIAMGMGFTLTIEKIDEPHT